MTKKPDPADWFARNVKKAEADASEAAARGDQMRSKQRAKEAEGYLESERNIRAHRNRLNNP